MNDQSLELVRLSPEDLVSVSQAYSMRHDDPAAQAIAAALQSVAARRRYTRTQRAWHTLKSDFSELGRAISFVFHTVGSNLQLAARRTA